MHDVTGDAGMVASFVTGGLAAALITALVACMFGLLWFAFPLTRR